MKKTAPSEKKMKVLLFRSFTDVMGYCEKSRAVYYFQQRYETCLCKANINLVKM